MTILRDLLRKVPFPLKFRVAKALFRLGRPVIRRSGRLDTLATPAETAARLAAREASEIEILVILDRLPLPGKDAARVRMLAILKILTEFAGVTLILLYHKFENSGYEHTIRSLGVEMVGALDFEDFLAGRRFDVALITYPHVTEYMLPEVKLRFPDAKTIYDTVDVQFVRLRREAKIKRSNRIAREAERLRRVEAKLAQTADQTWCVTTDDREFLKAEAADAVIRVVSNIHEIHAPGLTFAERRDLLFIGNFEHRPNVDAVNWLLEEILPLIRADISGARLHIVGGSLPGAIAERQSESVLVHGFVENVEPLYSRCRVFVAPLRFGGGMKGKIGESLSYGLPVVTTTIGAEGFGLVDGEDVLLAEDPATFAANIVRVYHNKEIWQMLSDNGRAFISANLSPKAAEVSIRGALDDLLPGRGISRR